ETLIASEKASLFAALQDPEVSEILEVGIGGNPKLGGFTNLRYYSKGQVITGLDPTINEGQLYPEAFRVAQESGLDLKLKRGVMEALPFPDNSFDAVVSTLVLCSVADPVRCVNEVARVLRPSGKWLFIEHIAAKEGSFLRAQQEALNPLQILLADGCHLNR
ncbi:unnamed protein product, partial [Chrysoparadoxa australica]